MNAPIAFRLSALRFGDPVPMGPWDVIPILGPATGPAMTPLARALEAGLAELTEVSESGSVPEILLRNHGEVPIIALDGECLQGAKQNRILNITVVADRRARTMVPVSCVEAGRWRHRSRSFSSYQTTMPTTLRRAKARRVNASLSSGTGYRADQSAVWSEVTDYLESTASFSRSSDLTTAIEASREDVDAAVSKVPVLDGQVGCLLRWRARPGAQGVGFVVGLDLVGRPELWAEVQATVLRGYACDRGEHSGQMADPADLLAEVLSAVATSHESPGLGSVLRLESQAVTGTAVVIDGAVVHLSAYAA
jgi:hypothetical protein